MLNHWNKIIFLTFFCYLPFQLSMYVLHVTNLLSHVIESILYKEMFFILSTIPQNKNYEIWWKWQWASICHCTSSKKFTLRKMSIKFFITICAQLLHTWYSTIILTTWSTNWKTIKINIREFEEIVDILLNSL